MKVKMTKVCVFARTSTFLQDHDHQIYQLKGLAEKNNWHIEKIFIETISGATKNAQRPVLQEMIEFIRKRGIKKVLCFELSRIGRNPLDVLETLEILTSMKVSVYIHQFSIETLESDGSPNAMALFMANLLSSVANLERQQIRARMKSGWLAWKAQGGVSGRTVGFRKSDDQYIEQYSEVVKLLNSKKDYSVRKIAKLCDVAPNTVVKVKKILLREDSTAA